MEQKNTSKPEWNFVTSKKGKNSRKKQVMQEHTDTNQTGLGSNSRVMNTSSRSTKVYRKSYPVSDRKSSFVIGTKDTAGLVAGEKKAWLYLGRLHSDTTEEAVKKYISDSFADVTATVERLESKGSNASFKVGVDFEKKDKLFNSSVWPKDAVLKRFLFRRGRSKVPS